MGAAQPVKHHYFHSPETAQLVSGLFFASSASSLQRAKASLKKRNSKASPVQGEVARRYAETEGLSLRRPKAANNCKAEALQLRGRAAESVSFRDTLRKRTNEACEDEAQHKRKSRVYKVSLGQARSFAKEEEGDCEYGAFANSGSEMKQASSDEACEDAPEGAKKPALFLRVDVI